MKIIKYTLISLSFIFSHLFADCDVGYTTEIGGSCYYTSDLNALVAFATNSGLSTDDVDVIDMGNIIIWSAERLVYWDCSNCSLSGTIPIEIENLTELTNLNLSSNSLSGSIPSQIGSLTALSSLNLSQNGLAGSIPSEIETLTNLFSLYLNDNQLSGIIPSEIGYLTDLNFLNLSQNELDGSIPPEIGNLSNLTQLWLSSNKLSGTIPSELGSLMNLDYLYINNNNIFGLITNSICNIPNVNISTNQFCPPYPECSGIPITSEDNQDSDSCPKCTAEETPVYTPTEDVGCYNNNDLAFLQDLIDNNSSQIPADLDPWILGHQHWDLEDNRLKTFCCSSIDLTQFSYFSELGSCQTECQYEFSSTIPQSIGNVTALDTLALAGMGLLGSIPDALSTLTDLDVLILDENNLSGNVPVNIGNIEGLKHLSLHNNNLDGEIPISLWDMTNLRSLDLSDNQFSDTLSTNINMLSFSEELQWFNISGNEFFGLIPDYFCEMNLIDTYPEQFDFNNNEFCPPYPICFDTMGTNEELVDLGNQDITVVPYYEDIDLNGIGNPDVICPEQYCAAYPPETGNCEGYVDNWDPNESCEVGEVRDDCGVCGGNGPDVTTECCPINNNGYSDGMGPDGELPDDCGVCNGPNSNCSNGYDEDTCPNMDQYCGSCFGHNECIPQLASLEPEEKSVGVIDINTDSIRFHFSIPIQYTDGIQIISSDNSAVNFSSEVVQDSIIRLVLDEPLISNDDLTISIDPCDITNFPEDNNLEETYIFDADGDTIPENCIDVDNLEIIMKVSLLGDYHFDNDVDRYDLDTLLSAWETENYSYELGPWQWGFQTEEKRSAPWLQPLNINYDNDYNIHDLMGFVQMWNWSYKNSLFREIQSQPTINYVPGYNFQNKSMTLNLENYPGEIKRIWIQLNINDSNIEIENSIISSQFDINLHGSHIEHGIYDWLIGSFSPLEKRDISLFNIVSSPTSIDQNLKLKYEIVGFDQEISSGEIDFTYHPIPEKITISPPYPNPFNPITIIKYGIPEKSDVLIEIYNIQGRLIDKRVRPDMKAGYYTFTWNGSNQSSGIYLIRMKISNTVQNYRTILIK